MAYQKFKEKKGALGLYIALLVLALAAMISIRQCSTRRIPPRADTIAGGDTINVAIEISPSGLSLAGDTLSGEYYNLLRDVERRHGLKLRFHPFTRPEEAVEWLRKGRVRLVVGDLPVTAEMRRELIFIDPVGVDKQVLVQRADTAPDAGRRLAVANQLELGGKTVYVAKGAPFLQRLRNLSHEIGDTIYVVEDSLYSSEQLAILTAIGQIPMAVVNRSTAREIARSYPQLDCSIDVSLNQFQSWALAPADSTLRDSLNVWLHPAK